MNIKNRYQQQGIINPLVVVTVVLLLLVFGLGGLSIWAYMGYADQKNNVDIKISSAVAIAKKEQADSDAKDFAEREKQPVRPFNGPEDLGHVQFNFPRTWSVYLGNSGADGSGFETYFQPDVVQAIGTKLSALRVSIVNTPYDQVLSSYTDIVRQGNLKSSPITIDGSVGIRLDGSFNDQVQGSMVIMKIRDKTLRVFTESKIFVSDFDNYVLPSLKFNK
ncbi:MAG TPA: hypothetical protein VNX65_02855 [Patescibacteria group bacterium]|jgi:hypothetical protein|nr:hypothetical protein [Patescibacteria group bacterium]